MKFSAQFLTLSLFVLLLNCTAEPKYFTASINNGDPHTYSNFDEVVVKHIDFNFNINFEKSVITGEAVYRINNFSNSNELILDTKNLKIDRIKINDNNAPVLFSLSRADSILGQALKIQITPETESVTIYYSTTEKSEALQWLSPENTAGGKYPFLYTDSQPILSRTWFPCQDSPGVRQTYTSKIKTMPGLMVVMSGKNPTEKNTDGIYKVEMTQPLPSYLIALASGDFEYRKLGPRTGVYAESYIIDEAAAEFEDTEKFIDAAESLYGKYKWDDYNMLVMPPSYPLGGMENPRINFLTPTIISGDKSLLALVAHELAHSWSGNLVTNKNWNDLWINEGFTSYFEHRIMEEIYGKDYQKMLAHLDQNKLYHVVGKLQGEEELTKLHLDLKGIDPEGNSGHVAYEKGTFFLMLIEETVGRKKFDNFLNSYFEEFAFKTMTSDKFIEYLRENLIKGNEKIEKDLMIEQWVYSPGIPEKIILNNSEEFLKVDNQLKNFLDGGKAENMNTDNWTTHHWLHFIRALPWELEKTELYELDAAFDFTNSGNYEILHSWLLRGIHNKYAPSMQAAEKFLTTVGRTKFLRPLYSKLAETPEGLEKAREIYSSTKHIYHSTSKQRIERILY